MVSKSKKIRNEVKRAFRLPSNAVVMSMMAVILVCAAPALVSIIDESDSSVMYTKDGLNFKDSDISNLCVQIWRSEAPENLNKTYATSDIGSFIFSFDSPSASDYVLSYEIRNLDFSDKGLTKIDVSTSDPIKVVRLKVNNIKFYDFAKISDTEHILDVDQIAALNIASGDKVAIVIYTLAEYDYGPGFIIDSTAYYGTTIPYGEIIIGATGALLIVCAILATPWVSTSGLTVKRRR